jgi:hypothetical protein
MPFNFQAHQLNPYNPAVCVSHCNTTPIYNNQLQCGAPTALSALLSGEPAIAQCIINLEAAKRACIDNCNKKTF